MSSTGLNDAMKDRKLSLDSGRRTATDPTSGDPINQLSVPSVEFGSSSSKKFDDPDPVYERRRKQVLAAKAELRKILIFFEAAGRILWALTGFLFTFYEAFGFNCSLCEDVKQHVMTPWILGGSITLSANPMITILVAGVFSKLGMQRIRLPRTLRVVLSRLLKPVLRVGLLLCSVYLMDYLNDFYSICIVVCASLSLMILADSLATEEVGFLDLGMSACVHSGFHIMKGSPNCFPKLLIIVLVAYGVEEMNKWVLHRVLYLRSRIYLEKDIAEEVVARKSYNIELVMLSVRNPMRQWA